MKTTGLTAQGQQMLSVMDNRLPEEGQRGTDHTTDFKTVFWCTGPSTHVIILHVVLHTPNI